MRKATTLVFLSIVCLAVGAFARDSNPSSFAATADAVYFIADDGEHGIELWRTDGTTEGTRLVKDLEPGPGRSYSGGLIAVGNTVLFLNDGDLWKTNGTADGTVFVADLPENSIWRPSALGDRIVMLQRDGLWASDGTAAGTGNIGDVRGFDDATEPITVVGAFAYIPSDDGIWRTDGTAAGTSLVVAESVFDRYSARVLGFRGEAYVLHVRMLRKITPAGVELIYASPFPSGFPEPVAFTGSGVFYFSARVYTGTDSFPLFRSDGTAAGTTMVGLFTEDDLFRAVEYGAVLADDTLLFMTRQALWRSDGTRAGTVPIGPELFPKTGFVPLAGGHVFSALDRDPPATLAPAGDELYWTDGTTGGTRLVRDIYPGPNSSAPQELIAWRDLVLFRARDQRGGMELWRTDGTTAGTVRVRNINPEGTIAGRITDGATGAPVAGAVVQAWDKSATNLFSLYAEAVSDSDGRYRLDALGDGTYAVRTANTTGYIDEVYRDLPCPDCRMESGTLFTITSQNVVTGVDILLARGGRVAGRVTDARNGAGIAGVRVEILDNQGRLVTAAKSDAGGAYLSDGGMPAGSYQARTTNASDFNDAQYGGAINVAGSATTGGIDFALQPRGRVAGRVTDRVSHDPVPFTEVLVHDSAKRLVSSHRADKAGAFDFALADGSYFIAVASVPFRYHALMWPALDCPSGIQTCLAQAQSVTVTSGSTKALDFALARSSRFIEGRVLDRKSGQPVEHVSIFARSTDGRITLEAAAKYPDGRYAIPSVPAGTYYVHATVSSDEYSNTAYPDVPCRSNCGTVGTVVTVGADSVSGVDILMKRLPRIQGIVVDSQGRPIEGVILTVYNATGQDITEMGSRANGRFASAALATHGTYYLRGAGDHVESALHGGVPCPLQCDVKQGTPVIIEEGDVADVRFVLRRKPVLSGRVVDAATNRPVVGARVNVGGEQPVQTDANGQFTGWQEAGNVFLTAQAAGYATQRYGGVDCETCADDDGTRLTLAYDEIRTGLEFRLNRAASVSGRIVDALTGRPLWDARVFVNDAKTGHSLTSVATDRGGYYATRAVLGNGRYLISARSSSHLDQFWPGTDCGRPCNSTPVGAQTITSRHGVSVTGIDFALKGADTDVRFQFVDAVTGAPVAGVSAELFLFNRRSHAFNEVSDANGYLSVRVPAFQYHLRTKAVGGYLAMLYSDTVCAGLCDVGRGRPIEVRANQPSVLQVRVPLRRMGIDGASPSRGLTAGGRRITIHGGGFAAGATVLFGDTPAKVLSVSPSAIEVEVPARPAAGFVSLTVTNPDGLTQTHETGFEYVAGTSCKPIAAFVTQTFAPEQHMWVVEVNVTTGEPSWVMHHQGRPGDAGFHSLTSERYAVFPQATEERWQTIRVSSACEVKDYLIRLDPNHRRSVR